VVSGFLGCCVVSGAVVDGGEAVDARCRLVMRRGGRRGDGGGGCHGDGRRGEN